MRKKNGFLDFLTQLNVCKIGCLYLTPLKKVKKLKKLKKVQPPPMLLRNDLIGWVAAKPRKPFRQSAGVYFWARQGYG